MLQFFNLDKSGGLTSLEPDASMAKIKCSLAEYSVRRKISSTVLKWDTNAFTIYAKPDKNARKNFDELFKMNLLMQGQAMWGS